MNLCETPKMALPVMDKWRLDIHNFQTKSRWRILTLDLPITSHNSFIVETSENRSQKIFLSGYCFPASTFFPFWESALKPTIVRIIPIISSTPPPIIPMVARMK